MVELTCNLNSHDLKKNKPDLLNDIRQRCAEYYRQQEQFDEVAFYLMKMGDWQEVFNVWNLSIEQEQKAQALAIYQRISLVLRFTRLPSVLKYTMQLRQAQAQGEAYALYGLIQCAIALCHVDIGVQRLQELDFLLARPECAEFSGRFPEHMRLAWRHQLANCRK